MITMLLLIVFGLLFGTQQLEFCAPFFGALIKDRIGIFAYQTPSII